LRSVEFHKGAVASIEADWWWIKMRGTLKRGWFIKVRLREKNAGSTLYAALQDEARTREHLDFDFVEDHDFIVIRLVRLTQRSGWLAWIIAYLAKAGLLDRNQELTAYANFELAYP
jgi:hypothetical protein